MQRRVTMAAGAVLLSACAMQQLATAPAQPSALAMQQDKPQLALAEHLLGNYFGADIASPPTVCLAVETGKGPAALPPEDEVQLIEHFDRLAPFARCQHGDSGWIDRGSNQPALVFSIRALTCASPSECNGWAGYNAGAGANEDTLYHLHFSRGSWQVEADRQGPTEL